MNDRAVIRGLIRQGAQINIIGDSLAAGAGSSDSYSTEEVILHDGDDVFVRRAAPNSWWSRFQNYIDDKYPGCTVVNNGCGGAFPSAEESLPSVFQEDKDDIIFLFLGANDRKRVNGMDELRSNLTWMIRYFKEKISQSYCLPLIRLPQRMNPIKTGFIIWRTLPILLLMWQRRKISL